MNIVFSVDDLSDPFWQTAVATPPTAMNKSESQWALERFLQEFSASPSSSASDNTAAAPSVVSQSPTSSKRENADDDVVEITKPQIPAPSPPSLPLDRTPSAPIDSEEYRAYLESRLHLACAAVAMSRASGVKPEDFPSLAKDQRLPAQNSQSRPQSLGTSQGISTAQIEYDGGSLSIPALPAMQRKQEVQARQTTSGSSKEDSDDDELEGDTETNENLDLTDVKRARRMQSNRESARRSRRRKQEQLNELESQVGHLRDERTTLLSRFTDVNKKCDDAGVDNRILKANIETLRAKVKMAEEQVKQVTGLNPMLVARSSMPSMGMQFVGGQTNASTNVAVQMQPDLDQFFHQSVPTAQHIQRLNNSFSNATIAPHPTSLQSDNGTSNVAGMNSMQLTASGQSMADMPSMQHLQKQAGPPVGSGRTLPAGNSGISQAVGKSKKKK